MHYNKTAVNNIYEEEVTEPQIFGRALLKAFTVAGSYAKQRFGVTTLIRFFKRNMIIHFFL